jgi:hypothetical protein
MLMLADGTFFPLVADAIPWGHASGPAGLAFEALQERGCSCKGFYTGFTAVRGVSFNRHRQYFSRPRRCRAHIPGIICVRCALGGVVVRQPPSLGPFEAIGASSSTCFERSLAVPPRDNG